MTKEPSNISYKEWVKFKTGLKIDIETCPECNKEYDKTLGFCPWCKGSENEVQSEESK